MEFTNKVKGLLSMKGQSLSSFSRKMGVTPQATNKKAKAQTWNAIDLLNIAELTNTTLAFNDNETGKPLIQFDSTDLKENE